MSTHVGTLETELELVPDPAPGLPAPATDDRSRLAQQLQRQRSIAARPPAEGFDD